jgi:hypothetical protein
VKAKAEKALREFKYWAFLSYSQPFTIYTRWRRALGRSALWRYYGTVITAEGKDLNELLVSREWRGFTEREHRCRMAAIRANTSRIFINWSWKQRPRNAALGAR